MNPGDKVEPLTTVKSAPPISSSGSTAEASEVLQHYKDRATALLQVSTFAATITFTIILTPRDNGQTTPGLVQLAYANALFCGAIIGSVFVIVGIEIANAQTAIMKKLPLNMRSIMAKWQMAEAQKTKAEQDLETKWAAQNMKAAQEAQEIKAEAVRSLEILLSIRNLRILLWFVHVIAGFVGLSLYAAFYIMIYATRLFLQYDGPFILGTVIYAVLGFLAISIWIISSFLEGGNNLVKVLEPDDSRGELGKQRQTSNLKSDEIRDTYMSM
jgi:hypothetical protein